MKTRFGILTFVFLFAGYSLFSQQLIWIGTLGGVRSEGWDVSDDGRYVVGRSQAGDGKYYAFRWDRQTGEMDSLGSFGSNDPVDGRRSEAHGISSDGRFVVGYAQDENNRIQAFLWDGETKALEKVSPNQVYPSFANGISADGRFIVGGFTYETPYEYRRAFVVDRQEDTVYILETLGGRFGSANNISPNGRYVVGLSEPEDWSTYRAFLWDRETGTMENLGTLVSSLSEAAAVTDDGRYVVGEYAPLSSTSAFLWDIEQSSVQSINPPGAHQSVAKDISADGRYVVGYAKYRANQNSAVLWDLRADTAYNLNEYYAALLTDGSELIDAYAISANGRYIVGTGMNGSNNQVEGYIIDTQAPATVHNHRRFLTFRVYPNPAQEQAEIRLLLPHSAFVRIRIFDLFGNPVRTACAQYFSPGSHTVVWNGMDEQMQPLPAGAYLCSISVGDNVEFAMIHLVR